ncbi:MAG: GNAT family N-acetyltransferase [Pseudomonadales bacterium]|jgi:GNAT superfamily N-acetyltransferase|nr:GNAT family N-acetyltransferase [Pseudomonadales bacterium]
MSASRDPLDQDIETHLAVPTVEVYCDLRVRAGLSARSPEAAAAGLRGSLFAVQLRLGGRTVGMGRVIGDGGCTYQVVDIAVLPEHQGKGLGKRIMAEIMHFIDRQVPESAYVSLLADGDAHHLYRQFGFEATAPASIGMALKRPRPPSRGQGV